jgi:DNA-binding transcriptional LysR family regulator
MEGRPQGLIRLHVPSSFARLHIMRFVPDFLAAYPDIRLDVSLTDVRVDLLSVGADLAIRIGPLIDSTCSPASSVGIGTTSVRAKVMDSGEPFADALDRPQS